jgi:Tannase and feruloyl esterase
VLGYVRPAINFEIRLPLRDWNGKFYMAGCGGFCGSLGADAPGFSNAMNFGLRRNYAVSTSDSGHWGSSATDGRWAMDNPVAQMDFGQRSVPETARVTKIILKAFYGITALSRRNRTLPAVQTADEWPPWKPCAIRRISTASSAVRRRSMGPD